MHDGVVDGCDGCSEVSVEGLEEFGVVKCRVHVVFELEDWGLVWWVCDGADLSDRRYKPRFVVGDGR